LLATAGLDGTVRLWDPATNKPSAPGIYSNTSVQAVAFSPDGRLLATAGEDGTVRVWDPATRLPTGPPMTGHIGPTGAVAFSASAAG
jgi:WD40 repeat protein